MVREMREIVRSGQIGKVRLIVTNFSHGHHGDATDADNPRVRWRYDPAMAGVSGQFADCGIHALHMASFIAGDQVRSLSADFASTIASRTLEDDAMVNFRLEGGTVGRLWTSSVAIGRQHGFDIQVFGETGGMRWASEQPNQVYYTPVGGRTQIMEKGESGLSDEASRLSRVAIAHPEGSRWRSPISMSIWPRRSVARRATGCRLPVMVCGLWRRFMRLWPRRTKRARGSMPARRCTSSRLHHIRSGAGVMSRARPDDRGRAVLRGSGPARQALRPSVRPMR